MKHLDDPVFAGRLHFTGVVFWLVMVPVAIVTGWIEAVAFVSAISITAMAVGHWSAREAATAQRDMTAQLDRIEALLWEIQRR